MGLPAFHPRIDGCRIERVVVADNAFANPAALIDFITSQVGTVKLRPDHKLVYQGRWEDPAESWRIADALGKRAIPNRVDEWGEEWDHDWPTWREMLPRYLDELLPAAVEEEGA